MVQDTLSSGIPKRNIAYKMRIGALTAGRQVVEAERFQFLDIGDGRQIIRINVIANIIDKFISEGEKQYGSLTLDDATGQIRLKLFGEDVQQLADFSQGDTVMVVGLLRSWNNDLYITPEVIKKKDPSFLLVRKLEIEANAPKQLDKAATAALKDKILKMVKEAEKDGGIDIDKIIMDLKESPDVINIEIRKLLEDGVAYEPRPGKLRYLG